MSGRDSPASPVTPDSCDTPNSTEPPSFSTRSLNSNPPTQVIVHDEANTAAAAAAAAAAANPISNQLMFSALQGGSNSQSEPSPMPHIPEPNQSQQTIMTTIDMLNKRFLTMQSEFERRETGLRRYIDTITQESRDTRDTRYAPDTSQRRGLQSLSDDRKLAHINLVPITFSEIKAVINNNYNYQESIDSTTLDIVGVYLRGQKILYTEAKVYCEQHLYALMLPAIMITAMCSVLSVVLRDYGCGPVIVSCLTAINSFILTLVTYLKLDAKAEAHKTTAYAFDKLQSICEFSSGEILLNAGQIEIKESAMTIVHNIGEKVKEIKEKNQFILPEHIRYKYPFLCSTNVFAEVKRLQNQEIILINDLKIIINERQHIEDKIQTYAVDKQLTPGASIDSTKRDTKELETLLDAKKQSENNALSKIIVYRNQYIGIDKDFRRELDDNIRHAKSQWFRCCTWLKT